MTITATARAAANRARDLAYVLLSRTPLHPAEDVLLQMVELLDTAGYAFETEDAPVMDGITITNTIPAAAALALMECRALAEDNPATGIAGEVFAYVTAPITGRTAQLPKVNPTSPQLGRQEASLLTRIALAVHDLDATNEPTTRYATLATLVDLHRQLDRLAADATVDNNRPCNRPCNRR
ncbi:hypothetical protein ACFV1C_00145 [Streptomyces sp. NPDC059605]|uniref:hypothetical protein n=1 Tax=Streptomyces sp. NPDC059605 TaxID=3346882 RepID=UPI0036C89090